MLHVLCYIHISSDLPKETKNEMQEIVKFKETRQIHLKRIERGKTVDGSAFLLFLLCGYCPASKGWT